MKIYKYSHKNVSEILDQIKYGFWESVHTELLTQYWISSFGSPNTVLVITEVNLHLHFVNLNLYFDVCENFNINVKTTAAEAPCTNGICERHNAIITDIVLKVKMIQLRLGKSPCLGN